MDLKRLSELLKAGLSGREIAEQLGVSEGTVWYARGRCQIIGGFRFLFHFGGACVCYVDV